ncbi:MAG: hypothetical protein MAG795_01267 [Candidatus Woesearchaeota archaeon]|nr:hypothetical protein [Candidatus Woesearchaeota archaeon]
MRGTKDKNILDEFCTRFCSVVEKHCEYVVVSGFVAISSGRTRATEDIDIIIESLKLTDFKNFYKDLLHAGFVCMQSDSSKEIYEYLKDTLPVRFTLKDQPLPEMELKFCKDSLDEYQIKTKVRLPLTGLDIWFSSINMNIAFKEVLLRSDKDLKDAEHLRKIYPEKVDESEIKKITKMIKEHRL